MKEAENRMIESKTYTFGRVVKCYNLPLDGIADLNDKYEEAKNNLTTKQLAEYVLETMVS
mgnify:CR=1 FL=1